MSGVPLIVAAVIAIALAVWLRPGSRPRASAPPLRETIDEQWIVASEELEPPVVTIEAFRPTKLRVISASEKERDLSIPALDVHVPIAAGRTMTIDLRANASGASEILLDGKAAGVVITEAAGTRAR